MQAHPPAPEMAVLDDTAETARFTRWLSGEAGAGTAESSLRIAGMHCAACATAVEQALLRVPGVRGAQVSAAARCATVQWQAAHTRPSALVAAVHAAGYTAVPDTSAGARAVRRSEWREAVWRLFVAGFCAMQVMMLATPSYVSSAGQLATDLKQLLDWGSWLLTLPVMLFSAAPFFSGAWRSLRAGRLGMDVPVALGMLVTFVASSGAAFDPGGLFGHEVYFDSLTMFVSFLLGGRTLELWARQRAEAALEASVGRLPETAWRENADGTAAAVSVLRLQAGDVVRVPVGQAFCADGTLLRGATRADESLLSGESAPVRKEPGAALVAGSLNLGAPVTMRVERVGADTRYEAIVALVREARSQRAGAARGGDRWAAPFLWAVLLLAAGAGAAWSVIDPSRAVWVAVSVLIVTCPCALSLAAPSALLAATTAMVRRGVLLRRIGAIESLALMQTLFIDKTGTLTEPHGTDVQMARVEGAASLDDASLSDIAASLAAWSSHPLAKMIAADGARQDWADIQELPGIGLQGRATDGLRWQLGRPAGSSSAVRDSAMASGLEVCLSREGCDIASFHAVESLRAGAAAAVRALQDDGVRVVLLSGDQPARVAHLARLLGLTEHRGGMAPQDKLQAVRAAQAAGACVGMVGDGINDAPVLAQADLSLAMGEGAQIARMHADGVLVSNSLADVVRARALAKKTLRVVRQNIVWAAAYNAVCVPLALGGWLPPWAAGLGMASSSLAVVLNALRLAR